MHAGGLNSQGILRARGGSSLVRFAQGHSVKYSPRTRR